MSKNKTFATVSEGKRARHELNLPILYFPVADAFTVSWIDTLGEKSFCAWLKLHTLVNRTDEAYSEYGNRQTIPRSIEDLAALFKVSKPTFYKLIKPLWNYGLIDIVEWKNHAKIGQKAMNIIVYQYPQNNKHLETKPLEKVRDYETDYQSNGKIFGKMGGEVKRKNAAKNNRLESLTVQGINFKYINTDLANRLKTLTVTVNKFKRLTVKKSEPINISNTQVNNSNTHINNSKNTFNRLDDEEEELNINPKFLSVLQTDEKYKELARYLINLELEWSTVEEMVIMLHEANIPFSKKAVVQQLDFMFETLKTEPIFEFAKYFVGGIKQRAKFYRAEEKYEKNYSEYQTKNLNFVNQRTPEEEAEVQRRKELYYNWLEE